MEGILELRGRVYWRVEWVGIRGYIGREGVFRGGRYIRMVSWEDILGW